MEGLKHYWIKVYTVENCEYGYGVDAFSINVAREHAKRIVKEGYWEIREDDTEVFHAPWRIVKVKVRRF